MDVNTAVILRIEDLCKEHNISTNKLATQSGISQSTINNIVNRRNNSTTVSTIKKLCDGLNISIFDFFHDDIFKDLEQEIK